MRHRRDPAGHRADHLPRGGRLGGLEPACRPAAREYADSVVAAGGRPRAAATGDRRPRRTPTPSCAGWTAWSSAAAPTWTRPATAQDPHARTADWRPDRDAWELALLDAAERGRAAGPGRLPRHAADGGARRRRARPAHARPGRPRASTALGGRVRRHDACRRRPGSRVAGLLGDRSRGALPPPPVGALSIPGSRRPRGPPTARSRRWRRPATGSASRCSGIPRWAPTLALLRGLVDAARERIVRRSVSTLRHWRHGRWSARPERRRDRRPGSAVHGGDDRAAPRRRGRRRGQPGPARAPTDPPRRAVLHVHGFCDYFFQTEYAAVVGRARLRLLRARPAQVRPLAARRTTPPATSTTSRSTSRSSTRPGTASPRATGTTRSILSAHSTGGLTAALWAERASSDPLAGMVLNSPWVDMHGPFWLRLGARRRSSQLGSDQPKREIPRSRQRDLRPQPAPRPRRRVGLRPGAGSRSSRGRSTPGGCARSAAAHAELHRGLDVRVPGPGAHLRRDRRDRRRCPTRCTAPTSCWTSRRSGGGRPPWARTSPSSSVDGALHDVVLSRAEPRARVYDEIDRWLGVRRAPRHALPRLDAAIRRAARRSISRVQRSPGRRCRTPPRSRHVRPASVRLRVRRRTHRRRPPVSLGPASCWTASSPASSTVCCWASSTRSSRPPVPGLPARLRPTRGRAVRLQRGALRSS